MARTSGGRSNAICAEEGTDPPSLNSGLTLSTAINPPAAERNFPQSLCRLESSGEGRPWRTLRGATITLMLARSVLWTFLGPEPLNNGPHVREAEKGSGLVDPAGSAEWQAASRRLRSCSLDVPREAASNGFLMGPRRKTDGLTQGMLNICGSNCYIRAPTCFKTRA